MNNLETNTNKATEIFSSLFFILSHVLKFSLTILSFVIQSVTFLHILCRFEVVVQNKCRIRSLSYWTMEEH